MRTNPRANHVHVSLTSMSATLALPYATARRLMLEGFLTADYGQAPYLAVNAGVEAMLVSLPDAFVVKN